MSARNPSKTSQTWQTWQTVTPQLRDWIIEQATRGCAPEHILKAMQASGWREDVAIDAMEQTLERYVREKGLPVDLPPASVVPMPDLTDSPLGLWAGDREVRVLMSMSHPRVVVFGGLLSDEECDQLVELSRPRLARSETVETETGGSEVNVARTSEGMFFNRAENPLCERIEKRIAVLLNWPMESGEGLQILRYRPGARYEPHYDYFDPAQPGTPTILKRSGQRVATLVMYLNSPAKGGGTTFPDVHLEVAPIKGHGVFFSYDRPHPSTRSLHAGAPVIAGEKWIATKWLRQGRFE